MKWTKLVWIASALAFSGCASVEPASQPRAGGVVCASEADCAEKWQRAEAWLRDHSYWPIRTRSETVIETERPRSRQYARTHYRVTRSPADGGAVIRMHASCQPSAHCAPSPEAARISFYRYLVAEEAPDSRP